MLSKDESNELQELIYIKLDQAESIWDQVGPEMMFENLMVGAENLRNFSKVADVDTQIPGYSTISIDKPEVDDFIALVADMRDSTEHLLRAISCKTAKVSQLQRVFYETSALLPVLAKAISYKDGNVTEYLGDGILGLFNASEAREKPKCIYDSYNASKKCLCAVEEIVNPTLAEKYSLPPLEVGIGLAFSKAVVTMTGIDGYFQPKVFGECVYRATKISGGRNQIYVCEALNRLWPTEKGGVLRFQPRKMKGVDAYMVEPKS